MTLFTGWKVQTFSKNHRTLSVCYIYNDHDIDFSKNQKAFPNITTFCSKRSIDRGRSKNYWRNRQRISQSHQILVTPITNIFCRFNAMFVLLRLPLAWASNVTTRARHEGVIKDEHSMMSILEYLNEFRTKCSTLLNYDWISIPLVYTQVTIFRWK